MSLMFLTLHSNLRESVRIRRRTSDTARLWVLLYFLINSKHNNKSKEAYGQNRVLSNLEMKKWLVNLQFLVHD